MVEQLMRLGSPIDRIFGRVSSSSRVVLDVRYSALGKGWRALAIHRAALFGTLHDAVTAAGIEIVRSAELTRAAIVGKDAAVITSDGRRHGGFDLIVDALGANSPARSRDCAPYGPTLRSAVGERALHGTLARPAQRIGAALSARHHDGRRAAGRESRTR